MALDYSLLTTRAECDAATAEADFILLGFTADDATGAEANARAGRTRTRTAGQLSDVDGDLASVDFRLTQRNLSPEAAQDLRDERKALEVRQTALQKRNARVAGAAAFLGRAEDEEVDVRTAFYNTVKAGIAARRAALPN